jgi:chromosome segregation ATPase
MADLQNLPEGHPIGFWAAVSTAFALVSGVLLKLAKLYQAWSEARKVKKAALDEEEKADLGERLAAVKLRALEAEIMERVHKAARESMRLQADEIAELRQEVDRIGPLEEQINQLRRELNKVTAALERSEAEKDALVKQVERVEQEKLALHAVIENYRRAQASSGSAA